MGEVTLKEIFSASDAVDEVSLETSPEFEEIWVDEVPAAMLLPAPKSIATDKAITMQSRADEAM